MFPSTNQGNSFSQAVIKDAVGQANFPEQDEIVGAGPGASPVRTAVVEQEHEYESNYPPRLPEMPKVEEKPKVKYAPAPPVERPAPVFDKSMKTPTVKDVFVKIDKFHTARRQMREVQQKLYEMDELVKKIRETKMREEQELAAWERDIEAIRSKIKEVTTNIFEKVD
jgi:hypothetical protein